jgi:hypothetical protein
MPNDKTSLKKLILKTVGDTAKLSPHAARLAKAKADLTAAEAKLKLPAAKRRRFLATFRLKDTVSATKGTYAERREHLITRIRALNGVQHHVSTSAWSMLTYHTTRDAVLAALEPAIDVAIDYLEVEMTGGPVHAGVSKLKS